MTQSIVGMLDRVTGLPATVYTPPEDLVARASNREDHFTHTERDAQLWAEAHDDHPVQWIGGTAYDPDDVPALSDLED